MKIPSYKSYSSRLLIWGLAIISYSFSACNQAEKKVQPVIVSKDSAALTENQYDSSQTPYICAMQCLQAAEKGDLKALLAYVHPVKGLTITHVEEYIENHERPFSIAELNKEAQQPTMLTIINGYENEDVRKSTLSNLLKHYANSNNFMDDTTTGKLFSGSKDIRRNYTGNGTYQLVPPLATNQNTISYHFNENTIESNWDELVLRTEAYQGKAYLLEILRAYWTP